MIPCHICKKDTIGGWVAGFPPAPDSQKMGLCKEHKTEEMIKIVFELWQKMLEQRMEVAYHDVGINKRQTLVVTVLYIHGGSSSFLSTKCHSTDQGTLHLVDKNGESIFIPLQQIKSYTVKEMEV